MLTYRFIVSGKVQGVYYRATVSQAMKTAHFNGTIKNLQDGTVEVYVSIEDDDYAMVISILEEGSAKSVVENITQSICEEVFDKGFSIIY